MTEQEDISSCYFTIKETWSRYISYFAHASLYLPDFDTFVWRLPSGTQANPQVCFRWISKCVNKRRLGKFGARKIEGPLLRGTWKMMPQTTITIKIKVFVTVKTCSSFLNYVSSTSLDITFKVSSSERRRVVLLMTSVQISPFGFICEREESSWR